MTFDGFVRRLVVTVAIAMTIYGIYAFVVASLSPIDVGLAVAQARDAVPNDNGLLALVYRFHLLSGTAWSLFFISTFIVWFAPTGKKET